MRKQTGLADPHRGENRRVCRIWKFTTVVITGKTATHDGRVLPFSICLVVCAKFIHADFTSAARAGFENGHRDRFAHPISTTPPPRMPRACSQSIGIIPPPHCHVTVVASATISATEKLPPQNPTSATLARPSVSSVVLCQPSTQLVCTTHTLICVNFLPPPSFSARQRVTRSRR
jgi:hypothetical protein